MENTLANKLHIQQSSISINVCSLCVSAHQKGLCAGPISGTLAAESSTQCFVCFIGAGQLGMFELVIKGKLPSVGNKSCVSKEKRSDLWAKTFCVRH